LPSAVVVGAGVFGGSLALRSGDSVKLVTGQRGWNDSDQAELLQRITGQKLKDNKRKTWEQWFRMNRKAVVRSLPEMAIDRVRDLASRHRGTGGDSVPR